MESVSLLSAFKASSYGCGEPGAPFQQGGKDQGKGQSMRHNDLILSHAVMRYCSLTCWEEDKECHTHLWEASIWTIKLEHSNASSLGLVVMLVVPMWTLFFLLPHYPSMRWGRISVRVMCVSAIYNAMRRASANSSPGEERKATVSNPTTDSLAECIATACVYARRSTSGPLMNQEFVFLLGLALE